MPNPKITTIIADLRSVLQTDVEGLKYITEYVNPETGCEDYPAVAIFLDREEETHAEGRMEARLILRIYERASDPKFGQTALQIMTHKVLRCINRRTGNFGRGGRFVKDGPILYGILPPRDGKPIFRADIQFTIHYTESLRTEES